MLHVVLILVSTSRRVQMEGCWETHKGGMMAVMVVEGAEWATEQGR